MTEEKNYNFFFNKFGERQRNTLKKNIVGTPRLGVLDCSAAETAYVAALYHQHCWVSQASGHALGCLLHLTVVPYVDDAVVHSALVVDDSLPLVFVVDEQ